MPLGEPWQSFFLLCPELLSLFTNDGKYLEISYTPHFYLHVIMAGAEKSKGLMLPFSFPSSGSPPIYVTRLCLLHPNKPFLQLH